MLPYNPYVVKTSRSFQSLKFDSLVLHMNVISVLDSVHHYNSQNVSWSINMALPGTIPSLLSGFAHDFHKLQITAHTSCHFQLPSWTQSLLLKKQHTHTHTHAHYLNLNPMQSSTQNIVIY